MYLSLYLFAISTDTAPWLGSVQVSGEALAAVQRAAPGVFGPAPGEPGGPADGADPVLPATFPKWIDADAAAALRHGDLSAEAELADLLSPFVPSALRLSLLDPFGEVPYLLARVRELDLAARSVRFTLEEDLDGALVTAAGAPDLDDLAPLVPVPPAPGYTAARRWRGFGIPETVRRVLRPDGDEVIEASAVCGLGNAERLSVGFVLASTDSIGTTAAEKYGSTNHGTVHGRLGAYLHAADGDEDERFGLQEAPVRYVLPFVWPDVPDGDKWAERVYLHGVDTADGMRQPDAGRIIGLSRQSLTPSDVELAAETTAAALSLRAWLDMDGAWHVEHVAASGLSAAEAAGLPASFFQRFDAVQDGEPFGRTGEVALDAHVPRRFDLDADDTEDAAVYYFQRPGALLLSHDLAYREELREDDEDEEALPTWNRNPQFQYPDGAAAGDPVVPFSWEHEPAGENSVRRPVDAGDDAPGVEVFGPWSAWQYVGPLDSPTKHAKDFPTVGGDSPLVLCVEVSANTPEPEPPDPGAVESVFVSLVLEGWDGVTYYATADSVSDTVALAWRTSPGEMEIPVGPSAAPHYRTAYTPPAWGRLFLRVRMDPAVPVRLHRVRVYSADTVDIEVDPSTFLQSAPGTDTERRQFVAAQLPPTFEVKGGRLPYVDDAWRVRSGAVFEVENGTGFHGPVVRSYDRLQPPSAVEYRGVYGGGLGPDRSLPPSFAFPVGGSVVASDYPVGSAPALRQVGYSQAPPLVSGVGHVAEAWASVLFGLAAGSPRRLVATVPGQVGPGFVLSVPVDNPGALAPERVPFVVVASEYVFASDETRVLGLERQPFRLPSSDAYDVPASGLVTVGADVPRDAHKVGSTRTLLLEPASTNSYEYARTLAVVAGAATVTVDGVAADGVSACATVADTSSTAADLARPVHNIPSDARPYTFSALIRKTDPLLPLVSVRVDILGTSPARRVWLFLNTGTGALETTNEGGPVTYGVESWGEWWRLWAHVENDTTGTQFRAWIFPAYNASGTGADVSQVGSAVLDGVQFEEGRAVPTSPIITDGAEGTRAADVFAIALPAGDVRLRWLSPGTAEQEETVPHAGGDFVVPVGDGRAYVSVEVDTGGGFVPYYRPGWSLAGVTFTRASPATYWA